MRLVQHKLDVLMRKPYDPTFFDEQNALRVRFNELLSLDEIYWKQRSCVLWLKEGVLWLKEGDRNSAFFHRKASNRRSRNKIKGLTDEDGHWHSDPKEVSDILLRYYENIFKTEGFDLEALQEVLASVQPCVSPAMNESLLASYTDEEIKRALFQMHPSKSPGPDGMSPFFYQKYWDIVQLDVCLAVKTFLISGHLFQDSNFTHLALIPKVKDPKFASELRPIALCNVVYKIASKVLANRLKSILPQIISPLQSAFIPGRLISDNTLVATEVAHFLHKLRRKYETFFSLKLDISKAYDILEWPFIEAVLTRMGFNRAWIDVIMCSLKSVSYSILFNGEPTRYIVPTRGIRQGDPLSPYLFILCAEGLSSLITHSVHHGSLKGLVMCPGAPVLHHLLFADDSFLFGEATESECLKFRQILNTYERASGQKINLQKSSVVFSKNVQDATKSNLAGILGVQCVEDHGSYLGLPIQFGRSKSAIFGYLKEKLTKKLVSWRSKILSAAGKEILIKVVAQAVPLYAMNCYMLPLSLCDDLQQLCAQFFWGSTEEKKKNSLEILGSNVSNQGRRRYGF